MKYISNKILHIFSKVLPLSILVGLLIISYIIFNLSTFNILGTKIINPLKGISSLIDDSILYQRSYDDKIHNNDIVIVKIDEKTLNSFSKTDIKMLSFSKELYSKLIIKLFEDYKVSLIGFDIIFSNKSLLGEDDENILRDTFSKYNDRIVIASMPDNINKPLCKYNNVQQGSIALLLDPRIKKTLMNTNYIVGHGCKSNDNIYSGNLGTLESFGFTIFKKYYLNNVSKEKSIKTNNLLKIFKDENTPYININYFTNGEKNEGTIGFRSYSLIDILNGDNIDLKGKIILVGEVGTVLQDSHFTPVLFDKKMPGVEINANIISTFMYDSFLKDFNRYKLLLIVLVTIIILLLLIVNNNIIFSTIGLIVIIILNVIYGIYAFGRLGIIFPLSESIYYIFIAYFGINIYKFFILDKDKRFLKNAFSMFVAPDIVDKISKNPEYLNLKGNNSNITVFFSDIEKFTGISEKMKSQDLFEYLNKYFDNMTKILLDNKGTLDKYIGDAIMGFFNAPLPLEKHEYYACKTALEQLSGLKELNKEFKQQLLPELNIRIGINTGYAIHGNLGARGKRLNYTVIGDNVNLASRLEGVNKIYGTNIIVSESVYKKTKNDFIFRELDNITVKGKNESVRIYELICFIDNFYDKVLLNNYKVALSTYYSNDYKKAKELFLINSDDLASIEMIKRCDKILKGELIISNGIYKINTK